LTLSDPLEDLAQQRMADDIFFTEIKYADANAVAEPICYVVEVAGDASRRRGIVR
jgi:hypothetical protein